MCPNSKPNSKVSHLHTLTLKIVNSHLIQLSQLIRNAVSPTKSEQETLGIVFINYNLCVNIHYL